MYLVEKISKHAAPHLHNCLEMILVTKGTLEIGMGQELFHMEKGDMAVIFPDVIHHCQVFGEGIKKAYYLWENIGSNHYFEETLQKKCPKNPVIPAQKIHPDIKHAFRSLQNDQRDQNPVVIQAYLQIILARSLPYLIMQEKRATDGTDLIYRTVSYIAKNYRNTVTLKGMAKDLEVSKYVISRVFSSTFHCNFNTYLNEQRLNAAMFWLENTDHTITDIWLDAGFESQRTFNRVFREKYKVTPRDYRKWYAEQNAQGKIEGTEYDKMS